MLEMRELQNFVAVAERLSVSGASRVVNLSQPALSRQIQALERKLGVTLFERAGKRLVLTAEGDDLLMHASVLLDQAQALANRAYGLEQGHIGLLRVGASAQTISWLLSPAMRAFAEKFPNVELILSEGDNEELIDMAINGGVHVAVAAPAPRHGLVGEELFQAELFALFAPDDPRSALKEIGIAELADERFLVLRRGFLTRQLFELACAEAGLRPRLLLESDSIHTVAALAHDGHGVAILSTSARQIAFVEPAVPLITKKGRIAAPVSALWNPNRHRPASLPAFVELLVAVSASGAPEAR